MRALTLTQPWCGLVASGIKRIENRQRRMISPVDFGKPFALHASREVDGDAVGRIRAIAPEIFEDDHKKTDEEFLASVPRWIRLGGIRGSVIAVATIERELAAAYDINKQILAVEMPSRNPHHPPHEPGMFHLGDQHRWFFGSFGYELRDIRVLDQPVPCRGYQGFWTLPADIEAVVVEQLNSRTP